jgi:hypothetical protein
MRADNEANGRFSKFCEKRLKIIACFAIISERLSLYFQHNKITRGYSKSLPRATRYVPAMFCELCTGGCSGKLDGIKRVYNAN